MDQQSPIASSEPSAPISSTSVESQSVHNATKTAPKKQINLKTILWDVCCVAAIVASVIFGKLWYDTKSQSEQEIQALAASNQQVIDKLEEQNAIKDKKLALNAQTYSQTYKNSAQQFSTDIESKDSKITKLKHDLIKLNQEKLEVEQRWRGPLKDALDVSQDIYAMKWMDNSKVLSDMENRSARTVNICEKWEQLCVKLEPYPEFAPQIAKLKIRLTQAYSGLGLIERIKFDDIDWEISGLADKRPEIEAHVWYKIADTYIRSGKLEEAKTYTALAKTAAESIKETPEEIGKKDYYVAMTNLLEADLIADSEPEKAMESYLLAGQNLSKIMTSFPANGRVKDAFVQACIDGAALGESISNAGNAEKLNKEVYKKILALLDKHPKVKRPKALFAEAKIKEAEELIQEGDQRNAQKSIDEAKAMVKKSGGDVLLTAAIDSTQAFIYWDHGQRTKALEIIDSAINRVKKFKEAESKNQEANYRLASLYWVRSSMRVQPGDAISDGQTAVSYLVELVQNGAGKREAAARRMIAIIYSDIGQQAYTTNQKTVAKQYFIQAKKQWVYLSKRWGASDEYKEGERWCTWRIKSL